jgi:hypothetical protein
LIVQGYTIGLVYYRTGYSEEQYNDETGVWCADKWRAREMLENSFAVKCPSVLG